MPRPATAAAALAVLVLLGSAVSAGAQRVREPSPGPAGVAARSLLLPGWGQHVQGQRRGLAYAAAEVVLWALWRDRRARGNDFRDAYRDLAWDAARNASASRTDGDWNYYETLSNWQRSGAWDRDPATPGVQPEDDPGTFNGSIWRLAQGLHFGGAEPGPGDPRYEAALAYYGRRAYGEAFLWDWTGKEQERAEFKDLIDGSDQRYRQATSALGAVLANHLLSAADAYLSAQVPGEARLRVWAPGTTAGSSATLTLTWIPPL